MVCVDAAAPIQGERNGQAARSNWVACEPLVDAVRKQPANAMRGSDSR